MKNGILYLSSPFLGAITRWIVARTAPSVAASNALPKFTTKVSGMGGAGIQVFEGVRTSRPGPGVA